MIGGWSKELASLETGNINNHVDTVLNGARETLLIVLDLREGASTTVLRVAKITAGAGVHRGNKHKISRIGGMLMSARDGDGFVLERLAEGFEDIAGVFGELIEEEDS